MAPILYYLEYSPPVRAVLLTAKAIGLELELKNVDLLGQEHLKEDFVNLNPQHTVPTLDDDGFIIWDSHAINAYLIGKYAKDDSLYPKDLQKRAIVDQRLHFDSGILFPRLRGIFFPILFLGRKDIPSEAQEAAQQGYEFANAFLEGRKFFAGDSLSIADFSIVASLSSVERVVPWDADKLSNLQRWMNTMKQLPYYQDTNGNGADGIAKLVNEKLGRN